MDTLRKFNDRHTKLDICDKNAGIPLIEFAECDFEIVFLTYTRIAAKLKR